MDSTGINKTIHIALTPSYDGRAVEGIQLRHRGQPMTSWAWATTGPHPGHERPDRSGTTSVSTGPSSAQVSGQTPHPPQVVATRLRSLTRKRPLRLPRRVRGWCHPSRASPISRAGAADAGREARSSSPAVPSPCHSEHHASGSPRSATDTRVPLTCGRLITGVGQHEW